MINSIIKRFNTPLRRALAVVWGGDVLLPEPRNLYHQLPMQIIKKQRTIFSYDKLNFYKSVKLCQPLNWFHWLTTNRYKM